MPDYNPTYLTERPEPKEGRFVVAWDATLRGLEIAIEIEGDTHRSLLPWDRLDEMRREQLLEVWAMVPRITEGVSSDEHKTAGNRE